MTESTPSEHTPDQAHNPPSFDNLTEPAPTGDIAVSDAPLEVSQPDAAEEPAVTIPSTWDELDLPSSLRATIESVGWPKPTPVQARTFAPMVAGADVLVQSQTGSGKTGAFCLPWLASRFEVGPADITGVQLLVLLPTRELAKQVCEELGRLATDSPVNVLAVYGGTAMSPQLDALSRGVHAVVGTPGRILDHIRRRSLDLSRVRTIVLDECDEMLSMGFLEDIRAILSACPRERQTSLFSATIPRDIERIAGRHMRDPIRVELSGDEIAAAEIDHAYYSTMGTIKTRDLLDVIMVEDPPVSIVFCNTREETRLVANVLQKNGYSAEALSSDLTQAAREKVMGMFRDHKLRFLVATDVAARGIDVSHVSHVINYSFPENSEIYVHRTGRTGRAGRAGQALSIVSPQEIGSFYTLTKSYKSIHFTERKLPPPDELTAIRTETKLDRISHDFSQPVSPEWLLLARRLVQDPRGERVVAYLLHEALEAERIRSRAQVEQEEEETRESGSEEQREAPRERGRGRERERDRDRGRGRDRDRGWGRDRERGCERGRDRDRSPEPRERSPEPRERVHAEAAVEGEQPRRRSRRRDHDRDSFAARAEGEPVVSEPTIPGEAPEAGAEAEDVETSGMDTEAEGTSDVAADASDENRPKKRRRRRRRRRGPGDEPTVEADANEARDENPDSEPSGESDLGLDSIGDAGESDESDESDDEDDESSADESETSEGAESRSKRKRRRRRRRRGGAKPTEEVAAAPAPQPARTEESSRRRRRQRRDAEPAAEEAAPAPEPPRVSQDQIIIDIDETELTAVRDTFGEIDEFDELTLKGRRRAVLDDLSAELDVEVVDLTDRDAEEEYEEGEDEGESDGEADDVTQAIADAESNGSETPTASGQDVESAGEKKKRRRRRRRKKAPPAMPELTCPPHKDFWEVWASKFSAADFQREEDTGDESSSDDDDDVRAETSSRAEPGEIEGSDSGYRSESPSRSRADSTSRSGHRADSTSRSGHRADSTSRSGYRAESPERADLDSDDSDVPLIDETPAEDSLIRVDLNIGRRHGQKAAHVRSLLRRITGLHGKAVKDLTVRDQNTLFRMDARHFETVVARLDGSIVESVSLTLIYAQDDPIPSAPVVEAEVLSGADDPAPDEP